MNLHRVFNIPAYIAINGDPTPVLVRYVHPDHVLVEVKSTGENRRVSLLDVGFSRDKGTAKHPHTTPPADIARMIELRKEGWSCLRLGTHFGLSHETVRRLVEPDIALRIALRRQGLAVKVTR